MHRSLSIPLLLLAPNAALSLMDAWFSTGGTNYDALLVTYPQGQVLTFHVGNIGRR